MKKLAIASALSLMAVAASAQTYAEIGYTSVEYEENVFGVTVESKPAALRGIIGYEINPNLAVEGLVGFGLSDDEISARGLGTAAGSKLEIDNVVGIYVKPKVKFGPNLEGFVRAGFAHAKASASIAGASASASESSFSYGLGLSYSFSPNASLNLDYMSYLDKNATTVTGITVGVGFKF